MTEFEQPTLEEAAVAEVVKLQHELLLTQEVAARTKAHLNRRIERLQARIILLRAERDGWHQAARAAGADASLTAQEEILVSQRDAAEVTRPKEQTT